MTKVDTAKWITNISKEPQDVEDEYNQLSVEYDTQMQHKEYQAPTSGAQLLSSYVPLDVAVMDAGCGTGLVGLALNKVGYSDITGIDISANCLEVADAKCVYKETFKQNLLEPLKFDNNTFGAVICVGVFSRFNDAQILMLVEEYARVVQPEGIILFSHREDLMKESTIVDQLKQHPQLIIKVVTEVSAYIPVDDHFKDIGVQYIVLQKQN